MHIFESKESRKKKVLLLMAGPLRGGGVKGQAIKEKIKRGRGGEGREGVGS